ncbi:unnamed protein product [Discosporangium mesarthrocarpum]
MSLPRSKARLVLWTSYCVVVSAFVQSPRFHYSIDSCPQYRDFRLQPDLSTHRTSAGNRRLRTWESAGVERGRGLGMVQTVDGREPAYTVVFVRHGQSTWNKANRFIGWTDTELTEEGELEARIAGQVLRAEGYEFDIFYTSMLKRAIKTAWVVLDELSQQHVPVTTNWHLNERCYGALVGQNKKDCVREYGEKQVKLWRRSFDVRPPPIDKSSKLWPGNNPKYKFLMRDGKSLVPLHESLKDVMGRSSKYWEEVVRPSIVSGKRVCICGHENNLRSLLKHIDGISDEDILHVELPRAVPLVYCLDEDMKPIKLRGAAPYISGAYAGDQEEIAAIMERDLKNVYDLSVSQNLEESERRFAAKLEDMAPPCQVQGEGGEAGEGDFTGTFQETGVGDESCRGSEITSTPLLLYNSHEAYRPKPKPRAAFVGDQEEGTGA